MVIGGSGEKLDNRVVFYWNEIGIIPKNESREIIGRVMSKAFIDPFSCYRKSCNMK